MASAAREVRYRQSAVDGNLARDLDWAVRERELDHAGEMPRRRQREAQKVHAAPKVQLRQRQHVSPFTVIGFSAVIVLAVLVLMSYAQLMILSSETVALKSELSTLETENVTLTAQYEQMFDLGTVREAAEAAGMTKPSSSQVCYLDISDGDSAVVYNQEDPGVLDRISAALNHGVYAVLEYFD
jgi:cell division protein FtsB